MKKAFFIASFVVLGLLLPVGVGFASYSKLNADQAQSILGRINRETKSDSNDSWDPTGPTAEDIKAATKDESLVAGSLEDKLINAVKNGDLKEVEAAIAAGANMSAKDKFGCTALFFAADKNHVDIVKVLIANGAAADKSFDDIFVSSVVKGNTEMVKALMSENSRLKHDTLETAYMIALNNRRCNPELFDIIANACNTEE